MPRKPKSNPNQLALDTVTPQFITWKKYGFRHIIEEQSVTESKVSYAGKMVRAVNTSGTSICGSRYWFADYPTVAGRERHDTRSKTRPMCGHCRKIWRSRTGQEVE